MFTDNDDKIIYSQSEEEQDTRLQEPETVTAENAVSDDTQPETGAEETEEEQRKALYEQLLMDTFRFRIGQVWKSVISSVAVLCVGIGAVTFLMTPSPGGTVIEADPRQQDILLQDDYTGKGEFVNAKVQDAHSANSDVVGWLTVDGCEIDDVVFQSVDNDYYLRKNEEGRYSVWGCYFMDYINIHSGATLFDRVSIIYGHSSGNSANGNKFSKIKRYRDADFAAQHPVITFSLLFREMKWEVFACSDVPITINYIDPDPDDTRFRETFDYMIENSYVDFGVDLKDDDQILLLSTCTADPYVRFVLAARLITD